MTPSWPYWNVIAAAAAVIAVGVGLATWWLARRQLAVMRTQLKVMERQQQTMDQQTALAQTQLAIVKKQDELMMAQLARRASLSVDVNLKMRDGTNPNTRLTFEVKNGGNKTARDFYWHVAIPPEFSGQQNFTLPRGDLAQFSQLDIEGAGVYRHFAGAVKDPLYPGRSFKLGEIACDNPGGPPLPLQVWWQVYSEDGPFPPDGGLSEVWIRPAGT
jgi:hypothetical protein